MKSFATPFSWGRSNIEYVLQMEKDSYKEFLNPINMIYGKLGDDLKLRLAHYNNICNKYEPTCMNGFEFTHHDVLADQTHRQTFQRRYKRLLELDCKTLNIFYHHRWCPNTDRLMLLEHLRELKKIYLQRASKVNVILFSQVIIKDTAQRRVEYRYINGIHVFTFYTLNVWNGNDGDIFWAKCDDDLIAEMFSAVRKGLRINAFFSGLKFTFDRKVLNKEISIF